MAEYYLMHKNIPVCLMNINNDGEISKVRRIDVNKDHFPLGGQMNDMKFYDWWRDRAIPKTRHGCQDALSKLGYNSTGSALVNNLALSLCDCYWIKPRETDLKWEDVNLFTNDFEDFFGEITLDNNFCIDLRNKTKFNFATSQGELSKKWCIDENGDRYLVKGNYGNSYQQSLNELFACSIHKDQDFNNYTRYKLVSLTTTNNQDALGCLSYDFCTQNIEMISAWELLQTVKIKKNESLYNPLKKVCLSLGMDKEYFENFIDYQIMTDYLITNTDRHMNNISILRNPDTLELIGFAPIYDSGNSMFYNVNYDNLRKVKIEDIKTHSFVEKEIRLLKYVVNRNAVDLTKINPDFSIFEKDIIENKIRIEEYKKIFNQKLTILKRFQNGENIWNKS